MSFNPSEIPLPASQFSRRTVLRQFSALGFGLGAVGAPLLLAGCSSSAPTGAAKPQAPVDATFAATGLSSQGTPKRGGTLSFALQYSPIAQLDPQLPTTGSVGDLNTLLMIYDQLTNLSPDTLGVVPGLASSWEHSSDGLTWTFTLQDAEFSNGDPVTAQDVTFSLTRFSDPKVNSQYSFLSAISATKALDAKHVQVTLKYPQGAFLDYLAHATASIVPQKVVEQLGTGFGSKPVGSGPFVFGSKASGQSITLERNDNYRKPGQPYLDAVQFVYEPDDVTRLLQVTSGQSQAATPVPYALINTYRSKSGTRLQIEPTSFICLVLADLAKAPLNEPNVIFALNYAIPRSSLITSVFEGAAVPATNMFGDLRNLNVSVPAYPYDVAKAKSYLSKSTVPNGFSLTLQISGSDSDSRNIAQILQAAWSEIGVKLTIQQSDLNTLLSDWNQGTSYDLQMMPPDAFGSDVGAMDELAAGMVQDTKYKDAKADTLVDSATKTIDETTRNTAFNQLQQYTMYTNPIAIPLAFTAQRTLVADKVQGLRTCTNCSWRLEDVWLS